MEEKGLLRVVVEAMPVVDQTWVDIFSALLTPAIAIIAVFIAYHQYRINKLRLQHELYERRLHVYKAVQSFLSDIFREGVAEYQRIGQFYTEASESAFLFDKKIQSYIDELYKKAVKMHSLHERMYPSGGGKGLPVGDERSKVAKENSELLGWFTDQMEAAKELFSERMKVG